MHHFLLRDVLGSLAAIALYPVLLLSPGYVIAWWLNLFEFRNRTSAFRLTLSVPLSIAITPLFLYLTGRFVSLEAAEIVLALVFPLFVALLASSSSLWPRIPSKAWIIVAAWLAISLAISVDLQIGERDYFPVTAADYAVRVEFIHSIGVTGVPPANPFFYPGHAVPLRYHYFWLLLPGLLYRATHFAISTREAWIGSVFWAGLGLLCLVTLALRVFWNRGAAPFQRRAVVALLLLCVTGLDIIPAAILWLFRAAGMTAAVLPSVEWWNDQVDGFVYTAVWEAHYLAGLIACLMALLLLHEGARQTSWNARARYAGIAGVIIAGSVGTSIYIALVFAVFLVAWTAIAAVKRWRAAVWVLAVAGCIALPLALPYALTLRAATSTRAATPEGGSLVQVAIRRFYPLDSLLHGQPALVRGLADLLALPLNYFLELGLFFVAASVWFRARRAKTAPFTQPEWMMAVLIATSVTVCTFVRSSIIANNDLGWRGFLLAQFGLLLLAADVAADFPRRRWLTALIALGAAGSAYDLAILRFYPVLADAGIVAQRDWVAASREGEHNYAARDAYEWIARSTPPGAVIQYDPRTFSQDTSAMLYAERQFTAADAMCLAGFGGDPALCPALIAALDAVYDRNPNDTGASINSLGAACEKVPANYLVAKDYDPVWQNSSSWVWREKPAFSNRFFRVFRCP